MERRAIREPANPLVGSPFAVAATLLVAILSVMPTGLASTISGTSLVPHLALALIFASLVDRDGGVGPVAAFVAGFVVDALTASPLGLCAAAYLAVHGLVVREAATLGDLPFPARVVAFALISGAVVGTQVAATMAVGASAPSLLAVGATIAGTVAAYPFALAVLWGRRPRRRRALRSLGG